MIEDKNSLGDEEHERDFFIYDIVHVHVLQNTKNTLQLTGILPKKVHHGKISTGWVWYTNVTDDRQADGRQHIPGRNVATFR